MHRHSAFAPSAKMDSWRVDSATEDRSKCNKQRSRVVLQDPTQG